MGPYMSAWEDRVTHACSNADVATGYNLRRLRRIPTSVSRPYCLGRGWTVNVAETSDGVEMVDGVGGDAYKIA
eukprot:11073626-Heterocapsa_arctica.AAC.1